MPLPVAIWTQNYDPLSNVWLSTTAAAIPVVLLFYLLAVKKIQAHLAAIYAFLVSIFLAALVFGMPTPMVAGAVAHGLVYAVIRIAWTLLCAVFVYELTVETGHFAIIKDSIGGVTSDRRLQPSLGLDIAASSSDATGMLADDASRRSTAARLLPTIRCRYVSTVRVIDAFPSRVADVRQTAAVFESRTTRTYGVNRERGRDAASPCQAPSRTHDAASCRHRAVHRRDSRRPAVSASPSRKPRQAGRRPFGLQILGLGLGLG